MKDIILMKLRDGMIDLHIEDYISINEVQYKVIEIKRQESTVVLKKCTSDVIDHIWAFEKKS